MASIITNNFVPSVYSSAPFEKEKAIELFKLYSKFLEMHKETESSQWMSQSYQSVENCEFAWQDLTIETPTKRMEEIFEKTGILQLRNVPKEAKVLVIGCGNGPIADAGSYALHSKQSRDCESEIYRQVHQHKNAITLNPHLGANPTLIGFFGLQNFPMLLDGQFDLIVVEGTTLPDTQQGRDELQRLLSDQGIVVSSLGDKRGYEFSWEDNAKNPWDTNYQLPKIVIEDLNIFESFNYQE